MQPKKFDKQTIGVVRKDLEEALAVISKHMGIEFKLGMIKYGEHDFKAEIKAVIAGELSRTEQFARDMMERYKLKAVGFHPHTGDITIIDYNSRARKNKFIVQNKAGNTFKLSGAQIAQCFGTPETPEWLKEQ